jgi:hypothetical protein
MKNKYMDNFKADVQILIDSIDITDNPMTNLKGQDYRELRDNLIIDWFESY